MKPLRILVAEDDVHIREGLVETLASEGYEVEAVADGEAALKRWQAERYDLLLLDIMMPGRNGYDVCREVRTKDARVPIIMLTAKGEEIDKVVGLQLGADDYITKPFGIHELLARVAAALRRVRVAAASRKETPAPMQDFDVGDIRVDVRRYCLVRQKRETPLSDRELRLLNFFHDHPDEVLSRDRLLNEIWGIEYGGCTRTLDQHIAQLRKKLNAMGKHGDLIRTVHGVGYRYRA
ncbi:MAG: response regulator transcription factor [Kiritimatiellae bacterium]|nr:response regulator transcription factor [Kiritimatiellia bacterium]